MFLYVSNCQIEACPTGKGQIKSRRTWGELLVTRVFEARVKHLEDSIIYTQTSVKVPEQCCINSEGRGCYGPSADHMKSDLVFPQSHIQP